MANPQKKRRVERPARSQKQPRIPRMVRRFIGTVVSDRMEKTRIVRVERLRRHPLYGKPVRISSSLAAHDEAGKATVGDLVEIVATRPISKRKHYLISKILKKGGVR